MTRAICFALALGGLPAVAAAQTDTPENVDVNVDSDQPATLEELQEQLRATQNALREHQEEAAAQAAATQAAVDRAAAEAEAARVAAEQAQAQVATATAAEDTGASNGPTIRPLASTFTRYELRKGYDDLMVGAPACNGGDGDCFRFRFRLGLETGLSLSDSVVATLRFLPQVAGFWAITGTSGGVLDPNLGLHIGSLALTIQQKLTVELGRFEMAYGEHVVIGTLGWHPNARAFDGVRVLYAPGSIKLDAFFTVLNESNSSELAENDRYFYGVYAALGGLLGDAYNLDVYALALQSNDSVDAMGQRTDWSLRTHIGSRFKATLGMIGLRFEGGAQIGRMGLVSPAEANLILAGHILGEVGLNVADGLFRVALEGAFASGDNPDTTDTNEAYRQLFPTAHAFLGWSDVMGGRSNVVSGVLHLVLKPMQKLALSVDTHLFARPHPIPGADGYSGTEVDAQVLWKPLPGLRARAMYAVFVPNEGAFGSNDPVHYLELEVGYELR